MEMTKKQFQTIMEAIEQPKMIPEKEVRALLGWNAKTWYNKKKNIPTDWYRINALGQRFYYLSKITGLK